MTDQFEMNNNVVGAFITDISNIGHKGIETVHARVNRPYVFSHSIGVDYSRTRMK